MKEEDEIVLSPDDEALVRRLELHFGRMTATEKRNEVMQELRKRLAEGPDRCDAPPTHCENCGLDYCVCLRPASEQWKGHRTKEEMAELKRARSIPSTDRKSRP